MNAPTRITLAPAEQTAMQLAGKADALRRIATHASRTGQDYADEEAAAIAAADAVFLAIERETGIPKDMIERLI